MSEPYDRSSEDFSLINAVLPRRYRPEIRDNLFEKRSASVARQLVGATATLDYDQLLEAPRQTGRRVHLVCGRPLHDVCDIPIA